MRISDLCREAIKKYFAEEITLDELLEKAAALGRLQMSFEYREIRKGTQTHGHRVKV